MIGRRNKWWSIVMDAMELPDFKEHEQSAAEALSWYANQDRKFQAYARDLGWGGLTVQGNLYMRDIDLLMASLWSPNPKIGVRSDIQDDFMDRFASAVEALTGKVIKETEVAYEIQDAIRWGLFYNVAYMKPVYDRFRQVPTMRHIKNPVIVDPCAKGNLRDALWVAEKVEVSILDFISDSKFSAEIREEVWVELALREGLETLDPEGVGNDVLETKITLLYVWSKKGAKPWDEIGDRTLMVVTDVVDTVLLEEEWDWEYVDPDAFPIRQLRFNDIPNSQFGLNTWNKSRSTYLHYDWAASISMEDAKIAATKKLAQREGAIKDPQKLTSGRSWEVIDVDGNPKDALHIIDYGTGSPITIQSLQLAKQIHDESTGFNDITRGESPGDRTTAEEIKTRKRASASSFKLYAECVDKFAMQVLSDLILALITYVPQWSRVSFYETLHVRKGVMVPGPMTVDPMTGMPVPGPEELDFVHEYADPEEAQSLRPTVGLEDGVVIRPGVDAWVGVAHAMNWVNYSLDQVRRDFAFTIEAGSIREDAAIEDQRKATLMFQSLYEPFMTIGAMPQIYELVRYFILSQRIPGAERFIPPRELFMARPPIPETGFDQDKSGTPDDPQNLGGAVGPQPNGDKATAFQQPPAQTVGLEATQNGFADGARIG